MSYGTPEDFAAYLGALGEDPLDPISLAAPLLARATAYIDAVYGPRFCGVPTGGFEQETAWPRSGAMAHGVAIPSDITPRAIKVATYRAAALLKSGQSLTSAISTAGRVKRQKVDGAAEREFFDDGAAKVGNAVYVIDAVIDGLLAPFLCVDDDTGGAFLLTIGS